MSKGPSMQAPFLRHKKSYQAKCLATADNNCGAVPLITTCGRSFTGREFFKVAYFHPSSSRTERWTDGYLPSNRQGLPCCYCIDLIITQKTARPLHLPEYGARVCGGRGYYRGWHDSNRPHPTYSDYQATKPLSCDYIISKKPAGAGFSFSLIGQDGLGCEGWS